MSPTLTILLPQTVMIFAACVFFLGGRFVKERRIWGPLCLLTLAVAGWCLARGASAVEQAGPAHVFVVQDALSIAFGWGCLGLGMLMTLTAFDSQQESKTSSKHFALLLLCLSGTMLAGVAADLIVVFLAVELVSVSTYVLLHLARGDSCRDAATKYFLLSILSSAVLLYGFSLLYGLTGTTNLAEIRRVLSAAYAPGNPALAIGSGSRLGVAATILIFGGLGFRLSIVPFHFGTPDIFQGTTAWNAGLLAVLPKAAAFVALIRVLNDSLAGFEATGQLLALILAAVTMTVGNVMALSQTNIRRILAYTTIAHGGFLLVGIAVGFSDAAHLQQSLQAAPSLPGGIQAALFSLGAYLLMTAGLFAVLVYLARPHRQIEYVEDLTGLHRSEPLAAVCAAVFLLGLAGVPFLPGFWGRMLLLSASLSVQMESARFALPVSHPGFVLLSLVAVINLLMTAAVYLRIVVVLFLKGQVARPRPSGGQPALAAAMLAALLTVGLGLLPGPALGYLENVEHADRPIRRQSEASLPNEGEKDDGRRWATVCHRYLKSVAFSEKILSSGLPIVRTMHRAPNRRFIVAAHSLNHYGDGQLSDLHRKSVEPIALAQRVPPRTLQNFLSVLSWNHQAVRDRVADVVCRDHAHPHAVGVIDETSDDKNGRKTPGVKRQWCGSKGKVENCIVTVHLAYATPDFHCLLDGEIKYFVAHAPPETPTEVILPVAFSRWKVERCFEDGKQEVGLDHYEGRTWQGLIRHLILRSVRYLFLAKVHQEQRGGENRNSQSARCMRRSVRS